MKRPVNIKEQYPEIAAMTVTEVINSKDFEEQYRKALTAYRMRMKYTDYYAVKSLEQDGTLDLENFRKEYIACIDKESKLPFAKRVVMYSIGNDAYARTINKMIKDYDDKKNS